MRIRRPTHGRPRGLQIGRLIGLTGLMISLVGCATGDAMDDPVASDPGWRKERIETLRDAIAKDHARLEILVTRSRPPEPAPPLHSDPEIRSIAGRLSDHKQELARLEALARQASR